MGKQRGRSVPLGMVAAVAALSLATVDVRAQFMSADLCGASPLLPGIGVAPTYVDGDTAIGSSIDPFPDCVIPLTANNRFFRFTGTGNGVTITTCRAVDPTMQAFAQYDSAISLYCAPCADPICITGADNTCADPLGATVEFCSELGREYVVMIHGANSVDLGQFRVAIFDDGVPCPNPPDCEGPGPGPCPNLVDFQTRPLGEAWGNIPGIGSPGDIIFSQAGIDVSIHEFFVSTFTFFEEARINLAPSADCLVDRVMSCNNINIGFDFGPLGPIASVEFDYLDQGGEENIEVNGVLHVVPDLTAVPANVAPGVTMSVTTSSSVAGVCGHVVLTGNVQFLKVGGQEFLLDDVCARPEGEPEPCPFPLDFESQMFGQAWGSAAGTVPGEVMFIEGGLEVTAKEFFLGTFTGFIEAKIDLAGPDCLDGLVLSLNNISAGFDFSVIPAIVTSVEFEYEDLGGDENLTVNNGPRFEGNLDALPIVVAPGVTASVMTTPIPGGLCGKVVLTGNVQQMCVGGQEFKLDNICVRTEPDPGPCPFEVNGESRPPGEMFIVPGSGFVEDGIPVRFAEILLPGPFFGAARIDPAPPLCLDGQMINMSNVVADLDFTALGRASASVEFEWFEQGGTENLGVNGAPRFIGNIEAAPIAIAPGVALSQAVFSTPEGLCGDAVLDGVVDDMLVGGQEFAVDNICVRFSPCPCEWDGVPGVDIFDLLAYLNAYFAGLPAADLVPAPGVDIFDLLFYLDCWFPASAGGPCP